MNVPYKAGSTSVRAFFVDNKQFNATVGECGLALVLKNTEWHVRFTAVFFINSIQVKRRMHCYYCINLKELSLIVTNSDFLIPIFSTCKPLIFQT